MYRGCSEQLSLPSWHAALLQSICLAKSQSGKCSSACQTWPWQRSWACSVLGSEWERKRLAAKGLHAGALNWGDSSKMGL